MGAGGRGSPHPLRTLPGLKNPTCWRGRATLEGLKRSSGSVPPLLAAEYGDHGPEHFSEGVRERDEFGCCCPPFPCCHVSMEMREGQDVPHSDYLGGWQGRHLVNILPSIATKHIQLSPADPQAHCLLHSLPFWSQYHAKWTPGRAAGSTPQPGLAGNSWMLSVSVNLRRAVSYSASVRSSSYALMTLCNCCSQTSVPRQNLKKNINPHGLG